MDTRVLRLTLFFREDEAREASALLTMRKKVVLVEGEHNLLAGEQFAIVAATFFPGEQFAIIAATNCPALGIATVAQSEVLFLSMRDALDGEAIFTYRERRNPADIRVFTRIHIAEVNILPMGMEAVLHKRYENGDLLEEPDTESEKNGC